MTGDIEKIRKKIGIMLWDTDMDPLITSTGFEITVDNTKIVVTIEKAGE